MEGEEGCENETVVGKYRKLKTNVGGQSPL